MPQYVVAIAPYAPGTGSALRRLVSAASRTIQPRRAAEGVRRDPDPAVLMLTDAIVAVSRAGPSWPAFFLGPGKPREAVERTLQDIGGGMLVDDRRAPGAAHVRCDQIALDRSGRQPLVPQRDRQVGEPRKIARERPCRLGARPLGSVHVDRQTEHKADRASLGRERREASGVGPQGRSCD